MLSGPICAIVFEGKEVVKTGRGKIFRGKERDGMSFKSQSLVMLGATNPLASTPGTIRGGKFYPT